MKNKLNKTRTSVRLLTQSSLICAMYIVLTYLSNLFGLASGSVQLRLSEALCILPFFIPTSYIGLFAGCFLSNLIVSAAIPDMIFGSLATLIGVYIASKIKNKYLVALPTVISNTVIVPFVIMYCYMEGGGLPQYLITTLGVFVGEVLSAYVIGTLLLLALEKKKGIFDIKRR